ncbi:MAG: mechanosensitive ion channel domain-containing protein [Melioribacteraceae bacterium]
MLSFIYKNSSFIKRFSLWLDQFGWFDDNLRFLSILIISVIFYFISKNIIIKITQKLIKKTKTELDDVLFQEKFLKRIALVLSLIIINSFANLIPELASLIHKIINSVIVYLFVALANGILTGIYEFYERTSKTNDRPIKGYLQIVKIIIWIFGAIVIIGILLDESPWALIGGLGALTAVLLLIFRDTILSFVASIQISNYDLVKVGDWIEVPKFGADGDVIDISLNIVKIQNFDKTITVIPTYKLVEDSFKNWRGMTLSGGRRIKRSVFIDQSSIKFADNELLTKFKNISIIKDYLIKISTEVEEYNKENNIDNSELVNGRRLTNVGTFRAYLINYLKQRNDIDKSMTFLVRQLAPGADGLPIEIYVFTNTTKWDDYESIQADIFDHILAVIPSFDLRIFQNPSGNDFRQIGNK